MFDWSDSSDSSISSDDDTSNDKELYKNTFTWKIKNFSDRQPPSWHDLEEPFSFEVDPVAFIPKTKWLVHQHFQKHEHLEPSDCDYRFEDEEDEEDRYLPISFLTIQVKLESEGMAHLSKHFLLATVVEIKGRNGRPLDRIRSKKHQHGASGRKGENPCLYNRHAIKKARNDMPLQEDGSLICKTTIKLYFDNPIENRPRSTRAAALYDFASLLDDPDGTGADITIVSTEGKEHRAHKAILIGRSPVFRSMLTSKLDEANSGVIHMEDLSSKVINFLLHFIYKGELLPFVVDSEDKDKPCISEVLYTAEKYILTDLLQYFDNRLGKLWCQKNSQFLLELAKLYSLQRAKDVIEKFINENNPVKNEELGEDN